MCTVVMQKIQGVESQLWQFQGQLKQYVKQLQPQLERIEPMLRSMYPYAVLVQTKTDEVTKVLEPYYSEDAKEIGLGLVLLFLGGHFYQTIACWQAFQVTGSRQIAKSWRDMQESYQRAKGSLSLDAEAKSIFARAGEQLGFRELLNILTEIAAARTEQEQRVARRRVKLLMECVDPNTLMELGMGLWTGTVAVLATLRSRFVQGVSVGAGVGKSVADALMPYAQPHLHAAFPNHAKWTDAAFRTSLSGMGALTSMLLMRPINAFNSAFQGSAKVAAAFLAVALKKGWLGDWRPTEEQTRKAVWTLAMVGFLTQLRSRFQLPLLMKVPLAPALLVEHILGLAVVAPVAAPAMAPSA